MKIGELVPGHTYKVIFDDCCVRGSLTDEFVKYVEQFDDPAWCIAVFKHAELHQLWGPYTAEEVMDEKQAQDS